MAVLLTSPRLQFFDNNGDPLSGGFVHTYVAGSVNTPKASYTDSTEVTSNSNPVELDSAGRASIWINGAYKIVVKDSLGNTISTDDNITSFNTSSTTIDQILPSQDGNSGKVLTTNGTNSSWQEIAISSASFTNKVLYGLTVVGGTDAQNDVDIAAGSCVSDDGSTVMTLAAITKQLDASWAVGTNQGGLDTGSVANGTYYLWVIHRTDTQVTDALFSTDAASPTLPTNYNKKKRIATLIRTSGLNLDVCFDDDSIWVRKSIASTSGTAIDFAGIQGAKEITINFSGVSTNGTSNLLVQIGDSGGIENSGYSGATSTMTTGATTANLSVGFAIDPNAATGVVHGSMKLTLLDSTTNTWSCMGVIGHSDAARIAFVGGVKSLSAVLDRVRVTSVTPNTFDAGKVNIIIHR